MGHCQKTNTIGCCACKIMCMLDSVLENIDTKISEYTNLEKLVPDISELDNCHIQGIPTTSWPLPLVT